jgi:structural maintenance of chromosome 4
MATAQGEVEQISLMKPKGVDKNDTGLLEYLEDIIGTDKYVEAIEEQGKRRALRADVGT